MPAVQEQSGGGSGGKDGARNGAAASGSGGGVAELLESTLWSRQLGSLSEPLVAALVGQVFEGAPPAESLNFPADGKCSKCACCCRSASSRPARSCAGVRDEVVTQ